MIPSFPKFIDFYSVEPNEFIKFTKDFDPYSDFNYVSVYAWSALHGCSVSVLNKNLVLSFRSYVGDGRVLTFIGKDRHIDTAQTLLQYAMKTPGYAKRLELIPKIVADTLASAASLEVIEDHDNHDYVLSAYDARTFSGKRYANKRKRINKFIRLYGDTITVSELNLSDPTTITDIFNLNKQWLGMGTDGAKYARNESFAIKKVLNDYEHLTHISRLQGIELRCNGKMIAFIIFELGDNYAVAHFSKSDLSFEYTNEFILAKLLKSIDEDYKIDMVNIEQDLGVPGLREHKMRHSPARFLQKYTVTLSELL